MRIALSVVVMLALVASASTAFGETTTSRGSFSFPFYDPCTNETVQLSAKFGSVSSDKTNRDGSTTLTFIAWSYGTAVGLTSGTRYVFSETAKQKITVLGTQFVGTVKVRTRLINLGAGQDLIAEFTFSIDEFGNTTFVSVDNCRGAGA